MKEWEKGQKGYLYDANSDPEILALRQKCDVLCYEYNRLHPLDRAGMQTILRQLLGKTGEHVTLSQPFYCDYGFQITLGEDFYANHNLTILDGARVTFGDHVYLGPNCVITTAGHPTDPVQRAAGLEYAFPISVGSHVWLGANVTVLPGVTIGDNTVIGAGSVVNRDIPEGVVAAGNPCRVIRQITPEDREKYRLCP